MENQTSIHPEHPSVQQGMVITDLERRIVFADSFAKEILGKDPIGLHCSDFSEFFRSNCCVPGPAHINGQPLMVESNLVKTESRLVNLGHGSFIGTVHILTPKQSHNRERIQPAEVIPTNNYLSTIVGEHPVMQHLLELIGLVASSNVTVHIFGENGTGKELVAEAIHKLSARKDRQMIRVNCSTIPTTLLESTLFGHTKGAFTGAQKDHEGFVEAAEGGTLFLDEIGDIPPDIQVKLLRLLQSREYSRVGDTHTRKADVRIITATNRDLKALMLEKKIREDFYYRIHVFPLTVPPLREHRSDIPLLIQHFISIFNNRYKKQVRTISRAALTLLLSHSWPGNIRELENAIEHAFVLVNSTEISTEHLPEYLTELYGAAKLLAHAEIVNTELPSGDEAERILSALRQTKGRKAEAAKLLGYSRITLWKKLRTLKDAAPETENSFS